MKANYLIKAIFCFLIFSFYAQAEERLSIYSSSEDFSILNQTSTAIGIDFILRVNGIWYEEVDISGEIYHYVYAKRSPSNSLIPNAMSDVGQPALPVVHVPIKLTNMGHCEVDVNYIDSIAVSDLGLGFDFNVIPRQPDRLLTDAPIEFIKDEATYSSDEYSPKILYAIGEVNICRSTRFVPVMFCPFRWNPISGEMIIYTQMNISIQSIGSDGDNPLINPPPPIQSMERAFEKSFINHTREIYDYDAPFHGKMLILIPNSDWEPIIQPFIDWKRFRGIPCIVQSLSIDSTNQTSIFNTIRNVYLSDTLRYVLLVGGHEDLPTYTGIVNFNETPYQFESDQFYTFQSGDDFCPDLTIGRFSLEGNTQAKAEQLAAYVAKSIQHEAEPPNIVDQVQLAAHLEPGSNYWNFSVVQQRVCELVNTYTDFQADTVMGHNPDVSNQTIIDGLEQGNYSLQSYDGHGQPDRFLEWCNSDSLQSFWTQDADVLQNTHHPITLCFACENGRITEPFKVLAEAFASNLAGGSVGCLGGTDATFVMGNGMMNEFIIQAIAHPDLYYWLPNWEDVLLFSQIGMINSDSGTSRVGRSTVLWYIWLGDPSLKIWHYNNPEPLVLEAEDYYCNGAINPITLYVYAGGTPSDHAVVRLMRMADSSYVGQVNTDEFGVARMFGLLWDDDYLISISNDNYTTITQTITIGPAEAPALSGPVFSVWGDVVLNWSYNNNNGCYDNLHFCLYSNDDSPYEPLVSWDVIADNIRYPQCSYVLLHEMWSYPEKRFYCVTAYNGNGTPPEDRGSSGGWVGPPIPSGPLFETPPNFIRDEKDRPLEIISVDGTVVKVTWHGNKVMTKHIKERR